MRRFFPLESFCFLFFIFLPLLTEGLGLRNGREAADYLILVTPIFLLFFMKLFQKDIFLPKKIALLFISFIVVLLLSALQSLNLQRSFEQLTRYISFFLIFIYVFNYKQKLYKPVIFLLFAFSVIYYSYSLMIKMIVMIPSLSLRFEFLIPPDGYQFVYPSFGTHNHLGDFLLLALVLSLYFFITFKRRFYLLLILFFLPPFLLSYSRSAYLTLAASSILMVVFFIKKIKRRDPFPLRLLVGAISSIVLLFFIASLKDARKLPVLRFFNKILVTRFELASKDFFANRDEYFVQVLTSVRERLFFGVGPSNFVYASKRYTNIPFHWAYSSHNIFLDILAEGGLFAFVIFSLIISLIIFSSLKEGLFFVFLAMLFNFQTDYTHTIYSFLLLFFVISGLIYQEESQIKLSLGGRGVFFLSSLVLYVVFQLSLLSNIFYKKQNYQLVFYLFPFNKEVYQPLIEKEKAWGNYQTLLPYLTLYERFFSGDSSVLEYIGNVYGEYGKRDLMLVYYERAYKLDPFSNFALVKKIYDIKKKEESNSAADSFFDQFLRKYKQAKHTHFVSKELASEVISFCHLKRIISCPYDFGDR